MLKLLEIHLFMNNLNIAGTVRTSAEASLFEHVYSFCMLLGDQATSRPLVGLLLFMEGIDLNSDVSSATLSRFLSL